MIPLNALLTPYSQPQPGPPNQIGNAMSGLGDFLEKRNSDQADEAFQREKFNRQQANLENETAGKNRYYDAMAGIREDANKEKEQALTEKRANGLMDMLAKAERSGDVNGMKLIHDQLKGIPGYSIKESDTATAPVRVPEAPAGPAKVQPPEFAGWGKIPGVGAFNKKLGDIVASEKGDLAPPAETTPPGTMPPEIAALAPPGASTVPSTPEAPKGPGGKYSIYKDDVLVHEFDAPLEKQRTRDSILEVNKPFTAGGDKAQQEDAKIAADYAGNLAGIPGMTPDKVNDAFLKAYKELGDRRKKEGPGGGPAGGPTGIGKTEFTQDSKVEELVQKVKADVKQTHNTVQIDKDEGAINQGLALLNQQTGVAQQAALLEWVKNMNGRAPAEKELSAFKKSDGLIQKLTSEYNWVAEPNAPLAPQFVEAVRGAILEGGSQLKKRRDSAATAAKEQIRHSAIPMDDATREQQADRVAGDISGNYEIPSPGRPTKKKGGGATAPAAGGESAAQKRARLLKEIQ